jgi:hypothetical protein
MDGIRRLCNEPDGFTEQIRRRDDSSADCSKSRGTTPSGSLRLRHSLRSGAALGGIPAGFAAETLPDIIVSYTALDAEVRRDPALMVKYHLVELPTTLPADRAAAIGSKWHGSTSLDVMLLKSGICQIALVENALHAAIP